MTDWLDDLFRARGVRMIAITDAASATIVSDDDAKAYVLVATGTVTASRKMQIAHKAGAAWIVDNQTDRDLLVGGPSGATATIAVATRELVYSNGTEFRTIGEASPVVDIGFAPNPGPVVLSAAQAALPMIVVAGEWDGDGCDLVIPATVVRADGAVTVITNATGQAPTLSHGATAKGFLPRVGSQMALLYWSGGTFALHSL